MVRVWDALGSSAFKYDARPRGDVVDPSGALESDPLDVRGVAGVLKFGENVANGNTSILKRQLDLMKAQLDLTIPLRNSLRG